MNLFNKIVIILLLLIAMILIPLILIFPEQAEFVLRYAADVIRWNLDWLATLTTAQQMGVRLLLAIAGIVVFLIGFLLLVLEIVRFRRQTVRLKDQSGELVVDSVSSHLAYHIDQLSGVLRVSPRVVSKGKSVRATLYVETASDVSVPEKSAEVKNTARQVIEDQLGLQVDGEIRVVIKPLAYPTTRRRPAALPSTPPPPVVPTEAEEAPAPKPIEEPLAPVGETFLPPEEEIEDVEDDVAWEDGSPFTTLDAKGPSSQSPT